MAEITSGYGEAKKDMYPKALADNPDDSHASLLRKSNRYYDGTFKVGLAPGQMQKLAAESEEKDITSEQMAAEIVKRWLASR